MDKTEDLKNWFVANFSLFEEKLNGSKDTSFHEIRRQAIAAFARHGFPTTRNEEWKYTSVAPILAQKYQVGTPEVRVGKDAVRPFTFAKTDKNVVVFVNGCYTPELSRLTALPAGVIVDSLRNGFDLHNGLISQHLGRYANFEDEPFTALNTAFTDEGCFIFVPDGQIVPEPIHIINVASAETASVFYPRNLFLIGKGSEAKIIESYHSLADTTYFNNLVTETVVQENARLEHIKMQEEGYRAFHVSNTQIHQERDSVFSQVNIDLGGGLVRNNTNVRLNGVNCESHLFGFYLGVDTQHIDNHTFVDHAMPHCFSNELYKGILDHKAKGVFNGKILVRPDAQKTNALQSNKTLLLTNDASIHAKPQLEIFADDVKCTHGATIGQLDDEALFYLRARGIGEKVAEAMLRHAFISDVLSNIDIPELREVMDHKIIEHFKAIA